MGMIIKDNKFIILTEPKTISWNKYKSEIMTQQKNKIIDHMIDPTFKNINILY